MTEQSGGRSRRALLMKGIRFLVVGACAIAVLSNLHRVPGLALLPGLRPQPTPDLHTDSSIVVRLASHEGVTLPIQVQAEFEGSFRNYNLPQMLAIVREALRVRGAMVQMRGGAFLSPILSGEHLRIMLHARDGDIEIIETVVCPPPWVAATGASAAGYAQVSGRNLVDLANLRVALDGVLTKGARRRCLRDHEEDAPDRTLRVEVQTPRLTVRMADPVPLYHAVRAHFISDSPDDSLWMQPLVVSLDTTIVQVNALGVEGKRPGKTQLEVRQAVFTRGVVSGGREAGRIEVDVVP
jgi:hypothetical protein